MCATLKRVTADAVSPLPRRQRAVRNIREPTVEVAIERHFHHAVEETMTFYGKRFTSDFGACGAAKRRKPGIARDLGKRIASRRPPAQCARCGATRCAVG